MLRRTVLTVFAVALLLPTALTQETETESTKAAEKAPDKFRVLFETTRGKFTVEVERELAPNGTDRFHELVKSGYYNDCGFFRVVPGFVVQFGLNGDPKVTAKWKDSTIKDDKVATPNKRGTITFAMKGPDTRTTQLFINYADNDRLDGLGFSPFGRVVEGMDVVDAIYSGYGQSPSQGEITDLGNEYLKKEFPKMDFITKATIVEQPAP